MDDVIITKCHRRPRRILIILLLLAVLVLFTGYTIWDMGYRGLPIASTCAEFKAYADTTFPKHELTKSSATECHYQMIPNASIPDSYLSIINAANPNIYFETGGTVSVPVDTSKLIQQGWIYAEDISSFGIAHYINTNNEVIEIHDNGLYSALIVYTSPTHHRQTNAPGYQYFEYDAPSFTVCSGITENANLQQILKTVGIYPSTVSFYENGHGELTNTPVISICYYIYRNGIFQNTVVEFILDAKLNAIHHVNIATANR